MATLIKDESHDIQALIVTGYGDLSFFRYLFLRIDCPESAKLWLAQIIPDVTHALWRKTNGKVIKPHSALNIAFTAAGFEKLGLSRNIFSQEFAQGMTESARAQQLGDTGLSEPGRWDIGGTKPGEKEIHVLLMIQAQNMPTLERDSEIERKRFEGICTVVGVQEGAALPEDKEHFGFRDSISQPEIEGSPKKSPAAQACIKAGEFVLGYENEYGIFPPTPTVDAAADLFGNLSSMTHESTGIKRKDFGRNGSYLVFRKLEQDVAAFRRYLRANADNDEEMLKLGAKLMGRWQSGTPIVLEPDKDPNKNIPYDPDNPPENDFYYSEEDCDGFRCPASSHIRRCNPRDSLSNDVNESIRIVNRHRIIRRGVPYGPPLPEGVFEDDGQKRGLLFFSINADIRRQFEFIQQTWANNPKFNGLYDDRDPIIGDNFDLNAADSQDPAASPRDPLRWCATIPNDPYRQRCPDVSRFVIVKGGAYFFLPSISALRFLAGVKLPQLGQEYPPPGEEADIQQVMEIARTKYEDDLEKSGPPTRPDEPRAKRDQHPKSHGCVKADFTVHDGLPDKLRYGIFKEPRTYQAWIRFSSSNPQSPPDTAKDAHGMAMKLMGVEGEKVLEQEKDAMTQDFIMANNNTFFVRSAADYVPFTAAFATKGFGGIVFSFVLGLKPFEWRFLNPFKWRVHELIKLIKSVTGKITNPLQVQYWSQCPSKLGPHAIKFSAKPCSAEVDRMPTSPGADFLAEAVSRTLKEKEVSFDFMVQLQTDPVRMPVEDATIVWDENLSPFQKVATIRIPVQDPDLHVKISENMSFTPWHSLPDHRPLGNTNRIRRSVYEMISKRRHDLNKEPRVEPTSTDVF